MLPYAAFIANFYFKFLLLGVYVVYVSSVLLLDVTTNKQVDFRVCVTLITGPQEQVQQTRRLPDQ